MHPKDWKGNVQANELFVAGETVGQIDIEACCADDLKNKASEHLREVKD